MGYKKLFWKVFGLDLIFVFLFILFGAFFIGRIYSIVMAMQGVGSLLGNYGDSITVEQSVELNALVSQLSSNLNLLVLCIFHLVVSV